MNVKSDTCCVRSFLRIHTLVHLIIVHFTHVLSRKYMNSEWGETLIIQKEGAYVHYSLMHRKYANNEHQLWSPTMGPVVQAPVPLCW